MMTDNMRMGTFSRRSGPCATSPLKVRVSPGFRNVGVPPMAVVQDARQHVNELDAGMLEPPGNTSLRSFQGHQERLEHLAGTALRRQQVIRVAAPRAAAHGLEAFAGADQLSAAVVGSNPLHQHRRRDAERLGQRDDGFQTRGYAAGLQPAQHGAADVGPRGDIRQRKILTLAQAARSAPPNRWRDFSARPAAFTAAGDFVGGGVECGGRRGALGSALSFNLVIAQYAN